MYLLRNCMPRRHQDKPVPEHATAHVLLVAVLLPTTGYHYRFCVLNLPRSACHCGFLFTFVRAMHSVDEATARYIAAVY